MYIDHSQDMTLNIPGFKTDGNGIEDACCHIFKIDVLVDFLCNAKRFHGAVADGFEDAPSNTINRF